LTLNNIVTLKSGLEVTQGHSKAWVRFPTCLPRNYGSVLHHLRDKASYSSKIVIFFIPLTFTVPVTGRWAEVNTTCSISAV